MTAPLLSLRGLGKAYPGAVANDNISFDIGTGEIHALLGENGAGKSTLVKIIYGLLKPDHGEMLLDGVSYAPSEPRTARANGIAMVFQHFSLFNALNVAENVALGMQEPPAMRDLAQRIRSVSLVYGLPLEPFRTVGDLSAGERQRVEIIRCLLQDPKLLIMDEPTSVLTPQEVGTLFQTLRQLRDEGTSILYISHKLREIRALCDHATILRHGRKVGECVPKETSARRMAELMVGAVLRQPERGAPRHGEPALTVSGLSVASPSAFGTSLKDVSFTVGKGEILGIGGVAGNGQDELLAGLSGEVREHSMSVLLGDVPLGRMGPEQRRMQGLLTAPEERLGHAAAPDMTLTENALMTGAQRERLVSHGFVRWGDTRRFAKNIITRFDVRVPGPDSFARALSGGNLQKFVIGREILQRPKVLAVNQPTWGVDAAAATAIRQALLDLAASGTAIVCISQDLDELLEISDDFAALCDGRLSIPRPTVGLTLDEIGLLMSGTHEPETVSVGNSRISRGMPA